MIILKTINGITSLLRKLRASKSTIGLLPTMGALHKGHISLLQNCKQICELAVSSIFINPTQFNNADDFKKYPVTLENDIYTLEKNGCDVLFLPDINEMYPDGTVSQKHFNLGHLEIILEGKYRPGHFQGVCQVVKRLLEIVMPSHLFMGQKDYQQCMVIKKLLQLENINTKLIVCPTLRQKNGLALSSRNLRLSDKQRENASAIYKALIHVKQNIQPGSLLHLKKEAADDLSGNNFKVDYIEIADADNLSIVNEWDGFTRLVVLAAAFIGDVRLIDNILLKD